MLDLLAKAGELQPDVVLLEADSREEDLHGSLQSLRPLAAAVLLTDDPRAAYVRDGARAVLPHASGAREIVAAIEAVAAGLTVLHADALETAMSALPHAPASDRLLTAREIEVLRMLSEGLANKEIAWRMGISEHTVKFHVGSLFTKLNASSRTEAVTLGVRQGLIFL